MAWYDLIESQMGTLTKSQLNQTIRKARDTIEVLRYEHKMGGAISQDRLDAARNVLKWATAELNDRVYK